MKSFANPIEFAVLGGFVLAVLAPLVARNGLADVPWGPVLPIAMLAAYLFIDRQRQRALSTGGEESEVSAAFDTRVHRLIVLVAVIGAATFAWALLKPPPQTFLPEEPPSAGSFDVQIGP
ncbi:MAG: hypothetical protein SGJ23_03040 [Alphaproteobacteria bacterium]|nr:hypothetical protein [Alphaproteobacteria bacterium]